MYGACCRVFHRVFYITLFLFDNASLCSFKVIKAGEVVMQLINNILKYGKLRGGAIRHID